jgi:vancomycin resistance protein YoaR
MPERQSSSGEVTARPETDATENGSGDVTGAQVHPATPETEGNSGSAGDPVDEQVAEQVAAEPEAVEPGPAEPTDQPLAGNEPVLTGAAAADLGQPAPGDAGEVPARPADAQQTGPVSEAPTGPVSEAPTGPASADAVPPADAADSAASPSGPAAQAPDAEAPTVASAVPEAPPRARPRPRPAPAGPDADRPTVRTAVPGPPAAGPQSGSAQPGVAPTGAVRAVPGSAATTQPSRGARDSWFNSTATEATHVFPRTTESAATGPVGSAAAGTVAGPAADPPTERIPVTAAAAGLPPTRGARPGGAGGDRDRPRRRRLLVVAGVLGVLALLYLGDLMISSGSVPRGVAVAGVQVGGLSNDEAEQRLRAEIGPRTTQPVGVTVGEARSELDPSTAGLAVDWTGTLAQAGSQPLNPITRLTSFFTEREVGVVTTTDAPALTAALEELAPIVDKVPVEGSVRFEGDTPVPVDPVAGQRLDVAAAANVLEREWATGNTVDLPLVELPPTTTPEDVAAAIRDVARPAVSAPVTVLGEGGTRGTISTEVIASTLTFRGENGELLPEINRAAVTEALKPQLASSERPGRDAALDFSSGSPVVVPSQDGRGVDYEATLQDLLPVLTGTGPRQITAVYADQPAELTTEELEALGITGVIGEFRTGGFAADSGQNIKRAAEVIDGTVVDPGETFSLNALTNPRNAANGYVEAGIISDGHPDRGVGGGVSQVATTLYNAAYFAGMVDVEHKEHSFYISRYPAGREATVFDDIIDVKFRNDNPTGVLVKTIWTPDSLTVRIFGTKRYEVTSTQGPRTNPTNPNTITIPAGEPCSPSQGAPGFTITDTRTLREISTGQVRNETRTVKYNPSPIVVCGA